MADTDRLERIEHRQSVWSGVWIGVAVAGAFSALGFIIYLLMRRRDQGTTPILDATVHGSDDFEGPMYRQVQIVSPLGADVIDVPGQPQLGAPALPSIPSLVRRRRERVWAGSLMRTIRLPANLPTKVFRAVDAPFDVDLSAAGPPGNYAIVGYDYRNVASTSPVGDMTMIPTGASRAMRVLPGQEVYARGSANGVLLSVGATEAVIAGIE